MHGRFPGVARLALGAAVTSVVLQSFGPIFIRLSGFGGLTFAFHRMWAAALVYAVVARAIGRAVTFAHLRTSALGGTMFAFNVALFFVAVQRTSVANATIIAALQPVALLFVAGRLFAERPTAGDVAFTAVSILGVSMVVLGSSTAETGDALGDLLAVGAMLGYAGYFAASKRARQTMGTVEYQASLSIVAAGILAVAVGVAAVVAGEGVGAPRAASWLWVVAMVAVPGSGHLLTNFAHAHLRLVVISLLTLFIPVGSALLAWVALGERLLAAQGIGIAVVVAGLGAMVARRYAASPGALGSRR